MNEPIIPTAVLSIFKDEVLAEELKTRGYRIEKDSGKGWETPTAFSTRHGHNQNYLSNMLHRGRKIPGLELDRAKGGRLVYVRSTEAAENWMRSRKKSAPAYDY